MPPQESHREPVNAIHAIGSRPGTDQQTERLIVGIIESLDELQNSSAPGRIRTCDTGFCEGSFPSVLVTHRKCPSARNFHAPSYLVASRYFPTIFVISDE